MNTNSNSKIKILAIVAIVTFFVVIIFNVYFQPTKIDHTANQNLPEYTVEQLTAYDGSDSSKPIYIGLNGLVYDVTAGSSFYKVGGSYHFLAGKDSSKELNLIGGDIIKRKYPVIGILK